MRTPAVLLAFLLVAVTMSASAGSRKALVIGNSDYYDASLPQEQQPSNLKNPVNDATVMKATLEKVGFQVFLHHNLDVQGMKAALGNFRAALATGDVAVVYFSGHGFQIKGENYLIPVHFAAKFEYQATSEALSLTTVLDALEEAGLDLKIVFLDCCRNDPKFRGFNKSGGRGLGEVRNTGNETLVCFSTKHGEVAEDNPDKENSNYTAALSEMLPLPGLKMEDVMKRVTQRVMKLSDNQQQPFIYGNLVRDWYLGPAEGTPPPPEPPPSTDQAEVVAMVKKLQEQIDRMSKQQPTPLQPTPQPAVVVPAPVPAPLPPVDATRDSILAFLKTWWASQFSNDPSDWAAEFAPSVDYCYSKKGRATYAFIHEDRRGLIDSWPNRNYEIVQTANNPSYVAAADGGTATLTVKYRYSYTGGSRRASGTSTTVMDLIRSGNSWKISRFDESVDRN